MKFLSSENFHLYSGNMHHYTALYSDFPELAWSRVKAKQSSILKACRPNKPSMQIFLWCGNDASIKLLWCGCKPVPNHALLSCLEFCLGRILGEKQLLIRVLQLNTSIKSDKKYAERSRDERAKKSTNKKRRDNNRQGAPYILFSSNKVSMRNACSIASYLLLSLLLLLVFFLALPSLLLS